ncbi:MAG: hypothetical protein MZV70_71135 [Desulfobacterales bacterium]|nr:hypothetical protein [Desulfobacterales bacterium]
MDGLCWTRFASRGRRSTISSTSTSRCPGTSSSSSPARPARASRRSPSTPSSPRASAATSSASRPTPASSSTRWRSPRSSPSRASRPPSPSTRRRSRPTPARPSAPSPRSTTCCRLLFARVGTPHCPSCGRVVSSQTPEEILKRIAADHAGAKVRILAPVVKGRKGEYQRLFERLRKKGFLRARVNGALRDLDDDIPLEKNRKHTIEVLVDAIKVGPDAERRLGLAVAKALEVADGEVLVVDEAGRERFFSLTLLCPFCEVSLAELEPRNFSFNSPYGACPKCHGLGYRTAPNEWGEVELTDEVCPDCGGARLKPESLSVRIGGRNIHEVGRALHRRPPGRVRQARVPARRNPRRVPRSSRRYPPASRSWRSWGCPTSSSTGRPPPSPAARPSGSGSRPRSGRASAASSTSSTSRRSASTSATTAGSSRCSAASATTATRSSSSSTTSRPSARPTTSSTSAPARARPAASRSPRAPWPPSSPRPIR